MAQSRTHHNRQIADFYLAEDLLFGYVRLSVDLNLPYEVEVSAEAGHVGEVPQSAGHGSGIDLLPVALSVRGHREADRLFELKVPGLGLHLLLLHLELGLHLHRDPSFTQNKLPNIFQEVMIGVELVLPEVVLAKMRVNKSPEVGPSQQGVGV